MAIDAKAKALKAQGKNVIALGIGQPDYDTPTNIKSAAKKAIDDGFTGYTPAPGTPELRVAIAARYNVLPENVTVSAGAKQALYNAILAITNPGDEVVIQTPCWVSIPEQVKLVNAKPIFATLPAPYEFKAETILAAVTPATRAVMINSPCNPTGDVADKKELDKLAEGLSEHENVTVISDEVYEKFVYDGATHHSISEHPALKDRTIRISAVSKEYAMTGWRIGYSLAPKEIASAINRMQSHITGNACSISQKAALEALTGPQESVAAMVAEFDERRKLFKNSLEKAGLPCTNPRGAFYLFADVTSTGLGSNEFCAKLLDEALVAGVPGEPFGAPERVRFSYAASRQELSDAGKRILEWTEKLAQH